VVRASTASLKYSPKNFVVAAEIPDIVEIGRDRTTSASVAPSSARMRAIASIVPLVSTSIVPEIMLPSASWRPDRRRRCSRRPAPRGEMADWDFSSRSDRRPSISHWISRVRVHGPSSECSCFDDVQALDAIDEIMMPRSSVVTSLDDARSAPEQDRVENARLPLARRDRQNRQRNP